MRSYLSLVPISAKVRRRQNRMTILCIALAVFLVTGVFSMADMTIRMERERAILNHGAWHLCVAQLADDTAARLADDPRVAALAYADAVNYEINEDYYIDGKKACIAGIDRDYFTVLPGSSIAEGSYPAQPDEVLLSTYAKTVLGYAVGDSVTLHTPIEMLEYRVCGFVPEDGSMRYDSPVLYMDKAQFQPLFGTTDAAEYYVQLKEGGNLRRVIDEITAEYQLPMENVGENTALLGTMGFSDNNYILGLYGIAAFLFVLVLLAGVFMIAGSLNSNVAARTQFFGMLRCIGASKAQIRRFVCFEALYWCRLGVPLGVLTGTAAAWGVCMALRYGIGGEFAMMPLFGVSPIGIVCGIAVGLLTVLLAARSPAKQAAAVSPVTAAAGNALHAGGHKTAPALRRLPVEIGLGAAHAFSSRKNLLLLTGSFTFSILLFLCFSILPAWTEQALNPLRPYAPDAEIMSWNGGNSIPREIAEQLAAQEGVKRVFGRMATLDLPVRSDKTDTIDLMTYEKHQLAWARDCVREGNIDLVQENADYVMVVYQPDGVLSVGDTMEVNGATLTIACLLSDSPVQTDETPTVFCTEQTFARVTGKDAYRVVDIQLEKDATDAQVNALRAVAGEENSFSDRREINRESIATNTAFSLLVYGFLLMIGLITVFYIVNSVSMSVSARLRQYGAMRAIGMDGRQLTRMIAAESLTYAGLGCLVGVAAGLPLHKTLYEVMITSYFYVSWTPPWTALAVILAVTVFAVAAAVYAPAKRVRRMAVTETIGEL